MMCFVTLIQYFSTQSVGPYVVQRFIWCPSSVTCHSKWSVLVTVYQSQFKE